MSAKLVCDRIAEFDVLKAVAEDEKLHKAMNAVRGLRVEVFARLHCATVDPAEVVIERLRAAFRQTDPLLFPLFAIVVQRRAKERRMLGDDVLVYHELDLGFADEDFDAFCVLEAAGSSAMLWDAVFGKNLPRSLRRPLVL